MALRCVMVLTYRSGTDEELTDRLRNFYTHIAEQKRKRKREQDKLQDLEDELKVARSTHAEKLTDRGQLEAEAKVRSGNMCSRIYTYTISQAQQHRIEEREAYIRELSSKHHMMGYEHSPLEREKVVEFISRVTDLKNRQNTETERLQVLAGYCNGSSGWT